jgi:translation initiation factor 2B subunit (eIF-2B alpha/beta/delta family)
MPQTEEAIAAIAADQQAGAVELADRAAEILIQRAATGAAASADAFRQELLATGWALIRAQPTMAPLVNLVNAVLWKLESVESPQAMRQAVTKACEGFRRQLRVHEGAIAEAALPLIPDGAVLVTNGRSSTVRAALLHAQRAGRRFSVICAESRPGCEGRILARELAESGITVTLATDAISVSLVHSVQIVLVGADHLTSEGLSNKAGTYATALACQHRGVPIYALCGSEKFMPPDYALPPQPQSPADQVWDQAPIGVSIINQYYDFTPLHLLAGVVTEKGVLTGEGVEAWLAALRLHPALADDEESAFF